MSDADKEVLNPSYPTKVETSCYDKFDTIAVCAKTGEIMDSSCGACGAIPEYWGSDRKNHHPQIALGIMDQIRWFDGDPVGDWNKRQMAQ